MQLSTLSRDDLLNIFNITSQKLFWLTYHVKEKANCHYWHFAILKATGGKRIISAPHKVLKGIQRQIKRILEQYPVSENCNGFVSKRSILTNAKNHVGKKVVIKMDLKDFFPNIRFNRVKNLFMELGAKQDIAITLAMLCTEPYPVDICDNALNNDKSHYLKISQRRLPQGSPASPIIANLIAKKMDEELDTVARDYGFIYTRYADDLAFSGDFDSVSKLIKEIKTAIKKNDFQINYKKTKIMRQGQRQQVAGIVVNQKMNISRKNLRRFRAILHNCDKYGFISQNRNNHGKFLSYLSGYSRYVCMVNKKQGAKFVKELQRIKKKWGKKRTEEARSFLENCNGLKITKIDAIKAGMCVSGVNAFASENFNGAEQIDIKELAPFIEDKKVGRFVNRVIKAKKEAST